MEIPNKKENGSIRICRPTTSKPVNISMIFLERLLGLKSIPASECRSLIVGTSKSKNKKTGWPCLILTSSVKAPMEPVISSPLRETLITSFWKMFHKSTQKIAIRPEDSFFWYLFELRWMKFTTTKPSCISLLSGTWLIFFKKSTMRCTMSNLPWNERILVWWRCSLKNIETNRLITN